jgi:hypothetical protein
VFKPTGVTSIRSVYRTYNKLLIILFSSDDPMSQRFPWIHLTPITALRETNRNVNFHTSAFAPPNPVPDFDINFYASHISILVISVRQLPCMVRDAGLMRMLVNHVRELHVHGTVERSYVLLRQLLVTLQYRGVLETVVLFNQRLSEESFSELLSILSGCAKTASGHVEELLRESQSWQMVDDCIGETSQSQNHRQSQNQCQDQSLDQKEGQCENLDQKQIHSQNQRPVAALDTDPSTTKMRQDETTDNTEMCANCDSDEESVPHFHNGSPESCSTLVQINSGRHKRHKADNRENNSPSLENKVCSLTEEDMLYDSIYNSHASDGDSRTDGDDADTEGNESFNIYAELLDESTQPKFSPKGLTGFGLVSDRSNCEFVEDVLERCLNKWPSLQKLALSNTSKSGVHIQCSKTFRSPCS